MAFVNFLKISCRLLRHYCLSFIPTQHMIGWGEGEYKLGKSKDICDHQYRENRLKHAAKSRIIWFLKYQIFRNILSTFCFKKKCALIQSLGFKTFLLFYCDFLICIPAPASILWCNVGCDHSMFCSNNRDQRVNRIWFSCYCVIKKRFNHTKLPWPK